ncbi:hypothetical protein I3843_15G053000 [Carya illinoinensis]|uniref:Uncharacterized protein n=1 Tax=Carya illinoinensis TaxID=32201 RepID=A0A922D1V0_CARIL|nr:hypothetical protein I3842_15G055700 [Carya illinoinensis]KAG7943660.1 hypothetical protein I3843_15G053000 [Carya illinoinensis]
MDGQISTQFFIANVLASAEGASCLRTMHLWCSLLQSCHFFFLEIMLHWVCEEKLDVDFGSGRRRDRRHCRRLRVWKRKTYSISVWFLYGFCKLNLILLIFFCWFFLHSASHQNRTKI